MKVIFYLFNVNFKVLGGLFISHSALARALPKETARTTWKHPDTSNL